MIEEILENLYKIEIPLPNNPLKFTNSYVIKAPRQNLIIDTGKKLKECMNLMDSGLRDLGVDLRKTDFFITHLHSDHIGLVSSLAKDNSTIYFSQPDADRARSDLSFDDLINFARLNGFPEQELQNLPFRGSKENLVFHILKEGDPIGIGDYLFKCIETPGHTKGHMSLYEPNRKIFVAGDHILNDTTPHIPLLSDEWNPLEEYLASLERIHQLDIEFILPGHGGIIKNCQDRIREIEYHHRKRLDEVIFILENGEKTAFQIASQMSWDIIKYYNSWNSLPVSQKWFATREAIAHLKYLEEKGMIRKQMREQRIVYSLN